MSKEFLNIVDDDDSIIGIEDRAVIHEKGLLHREVHVHFVTSDNQVIFQRRAKDKDIYPNVLSDAVGGHVEIGDSYIETAIKEALEETGVNLTENDLIVLHKAKICAVDAVTKKINHAFQQEFVYFYNGKVEDMKVENGKAVGFESWTLEKLQSLDDVEKAQFIPYVIGLSLQHFLTSLEATG